MRIIPASSQGNDINAKDELSDRERVVCEEAYLIEIAELPDMILIFNNHLISPIDIYSAP